MEHFGFRHQGIPRIRARCFASCPERTERTAARPRAAKNKNEVLIPTCRTQGQRRTDGGKGPVLSPPKCTHPQRHAGSGMAQGGPGHAQTLVLTVPVGGAVDGERSLLPCEDLHTQFRLVARTIASRFTHVLWPPHLTHTMTSCGTLIAPRRECRAFF